ncbi:hypothetical protein AGMMS49944_29070 [Spirochaetia bacterium]|nr:hypothetical protein AGMMS49944_29070 [Spirochaetia bacterium]
MKKTFLVLVFGLLASGLWAKSIYVTIEGDTWFMSDGKVEDSREQGHLDFFNSQWKRKGGIDEIDDLWAWRHSRVVEYMVSNGYFIGYEVSKKKGFYGISISKDKRQVKSREGQVFCNFNNSI